MLFLLFSKQIVFVLSVLIIVLNVTHQQAVKFVIWIILLIKQITYVLCASLIVLNAYLNSLVFLVC